MKKIVFLTGAGMSVESGFKTFRGNDGLWEDYPVEQVATHEGSQSHTRQQLLQQSTQKALCSQA